jgi:hypothetical protein
MAQWRQVADNSTQAAKARLPSLRPMWSPA